MQFYRDEDCTRDVGRQAPSVRDGLAHRSAAPGNRDPTDSNIESKVGEPDGVSNSEVDLPGVILYL
jgi:hypothetical protein